MLFERAGGVDVRCHAFDLFVTIRISAICRDDELHHGFSFVLDNDIFAHHKLQGNIDRV